MDNARLNYLFHRYVNASCTDAERAEFFAMVNDPANERFVKELISQLWIESPARRMNAHQSARIVAEILGEGPSVAVAEYRTPWLRIAASLLLTVLFGIGVYSYLSSEPANAIATTDAVASAPSQKYIKLPDGSTVVLNAGSQLHAPEAFGASREVSLVGEAYFDIAHDAERPFIVHTGNIKTTVLGTAFNIRAYPEQEDITVTVTRGKVKVSDEKQVLGIINPDEQITFNMSKQIAEQKIVNSQSIVSWIEKDIYFDDITIEDAVEQLEKRFNIRILLEKERISECRFTATFVKGEDLEQILRILCDFNGATLRVQSPEVYVMEGGTCPI